MEQDLSNKQYLRKPESINKIDITDNSQSLPSKIKDEENKRTKFEISENEIIQDQKLKTPNKLDKTPSKKLSLDDFDYIRNLGKGSFGEVILVKKRNDEKLYAMKAIDKNFLYKVKLFIKIFHLYDLFC